MTRLTQGSNPRAVIDEAAFRELVDGRTVTLAANDGSELDVIFADIGWQRMLRAVADAAGTPSLSVMIDRSS